MLPAEERWSGHTYAHWKGIRHTQALFPWVSHSLHFRGETGAEAVGSEETEDAQTLLEGRTASTVSNVPA